MQVLITLGIIMLTVVGGVFYAIELGKARGVGKMFENRRKRLPDQREGRTPPSNAKTKDGRSKDSPPAE